MKTIILIQTLVIAILGYFLFGNNHEIIKEKIEIVEVCEVIENTKPVYIEKVRYKLPYLSLDSVNLNKNTKIVKEIVHDTVYIHKGVNKFVYKDTLKNGFLTSTILADTIYKRDVQITTFDKKITKVIFKPTLYLGGSIASHKLKELNTASLNLYLAKEKFLLGAGYGYDLSNRNSINNLTLAFKIK